MWSNVEINWLQIWIYYCYKYNFKQSTTSHAHKFKLFFFFLIATKQKFNYEILMKVFHTSILLWKCFSGLIKIAIISWSMLITITTVYIKYILTKSTDLIILQLLVLNILFIHSISTLFNAARRSKCLFKKILIFSQNIFLTNMKIIMLYTYDKLWNRYICQDSITLRTSKSIINFT